MPLRFTPGHRLQSPIAPCLATSAASCVLAVLGGLSTLHAATLRVAWDASVDARVVGYKVSMGTQPGVYSVVVDAGRQTIEQFDNLTPGTTYYFVVQAYDGSGNLSAPSNEVSGVAPLTSPLAIMCPVPTAATLRDAPVRVTFQPIVTGGVPPVTTICSPPSGSFFPVGATPVSCAARDAAGASATCATTVVVIASKAGDPEIPCRGCRPFP